MVVAEGVRLDGSILDLLSPQAGDTMKEVDRSMVALRQMSSVLEQETVQTTPYVRIGMVVVAIGVSVIAFFSTLTYFRKKS